MMECGIIRDLFPSYIDGLTSEESSHAVEEHLEGCAECRKYLEEMKTELESGKYTEINKVQAKAEIRVFKKLRRRLFCVIILIVFAVMFLFAVCESYFCVGESTLSGNVEVTYENVDGLVRVGFVPKKDNIYIGGGIGAPDPDTDGIEGRIVLISYHVNPRKEMLDYQANVVKRMRQRAVYFNFVFIDEDTALYIDESDEIVRFKGDDKLAVEFEDKIEVITIDDLRTKAGIEKLR